MEDSYLFIFKELIKKFDKCREIFSAYEKEDLSLLELDYISEQWYILSLDIHKLHHKLQLLHSIKLGLDDSDPEEVL